LPYSNVSKEVVMTISARRKQPADRELKKERLELRLTPSAKQLIQRAMAVSGLTAGDLAYEGARRVLVEHERMVLSGADRDTFLDAVLNPPEPAEKLVAALRRHRAVTG
jgi:uncharacterized protein (DUF1778 family)